MLILAVFYCCTLKHTKCKKICWYSKGYTYLKFTYSQVSVVEIIHKKIIKFGMHLNERMQDI